MDSRWKLMKRIILIALLLTCCDGHAQTNAVNASNP